MLVPRTKTVTLGPQGFSWARPSTWKALPVPPRDFELSSWQIIRIYLCLSYLGGDCCGEAVEATVLLF